MVVMGATGEMDEEDQESEYWNQVDDVEGIIEGITGTHVTRVDCLMSQQSTIINWYVDWHNCETRLTGKCSAKLLLYH